MLSLIVWNTQTRRPASAAGRSLRAIIMACEPDIVVVTEGHPELLDLPHLIMAEAGAGDPKAEGCRKVLLFSRQPWQAVDGLGDPAMPPGRYVAGRTETPLGTVQLHGVCIPWQWAHVRHGRPAWDEHLRYCDGLARVLAAESDTPRLVAGDYNQRIPRRRVPEDVHAALLRAFPPGLRHATAGEIGPQRRRAIDHVSHDARLEVTACTVLPEIDGEGRRLSDHFGLHLMLRRVG